MSQKVYTICDKGVLVTMSLSNQIIKKIEQEKHKAFAVNDFLDLGNQKAIGKSLERLEQSGQIKRAIRGIYYQPKYNELFKVYEMPDVGEVAKCLARKYNWNICPSGNSALNLLGLSTQIPAKYIYISDGPNKAYKIGSTDLVFKHSRKREISDFSYKTHLVIQAFKEIGEGNVTNDVLYKIRETMTSEEIDVLLLEGIRSNIWIYELIKKMKGEYTRD